MKRAPTCFIDIDGTILFHANKAACEQWWADIDGVKGYMLPHVADTFNAIESIGGKIVLCTARPECLRVQTEAELRACGLWWHALVMGITAGDRVLVNDLHPSGEYEVGAIALLRNEGLGRVLEYLKERYGL